MIQATIENEWDMQNPNVDFSTYTEEQMTPIWKLLWSTRFTYYPALYACKGALLCFYNDLTAAAVFPQDVVVDCGRLVLDNH